MTCQHPSSWTVEAARELVLGAVPSCSGTDPEAWFARNTRQLRTCIRICAGCPVRTSCLAGALARGEEFGVWGGIRFKPAWAEAWVVPRKKGYALVGRDPEGASLKWVLPYCSRSEAEALARKVVYRGRRRAYVARWVRRIGVPVQTPGSWWIGPWTDVDPDRRTARMRPLVASMLRDRPVQGWPWELRLLVEFPASAVPKAGKPVPGGRRDLGHDVDHDLDHDRADHHAAHHDHDQHGDGLDGRAA